MALIFHGQVTWPLFQAIWNLEKSTKKHGSKITKGTVAVLDIDNTIEPEEIQSTKPKSTKSVLHKAKSSRRSVISTKDGFARVFENQILFEAFELHITAEFGVESLRFWLETKKWREAFHNHTDEERRIHANQILNIFIGPNALLPINIAEKMVNTICGKVANHGKELELDLFDDARNELYDMMQK